MVLLLEFTKLAIVGLVAGLFSSALANRDHRHRAYWQMRVAAYREVIEALSDLVYYYESRYGAELEHRELPEEFQNKLQEIWGGAFHRVRKAADSGAFLFSDEVNRALSEYMSTDDEPNNSIFEDMDAHLAAARKCLATLVATSKLDLTLVSPWVRLRQMRALKRIGFRKGTPTGMTNDRTLNP